MYQDAFKKLELDEIATLLDRFNPAFQGAEFDPLETTILAQDIPFYKGYRLLDIADYAQNPPLRRFVVASKKDEIILNFTNVPIYGLNNDVPITLNKDNVSDYVRFFFNYVRGRHGRFIITEGIDDIQWREDPAPSIRKAVGSKLELLELQDENDDQYSLSATMMFKDSLFKAKINVSKDGLVSLSDEVLLEENIPVLDEMLGH